LFLHCVQKRDAKMQICVNLTSYRN